MNDLYLARRFGEVGAKSEEAHREWISATKKSLLSFCSKDSSPLVLWQNFLHWGLQSLSPTE